MYGTELDKLVERVVGSIISLEENIIAVMIQKKTIKYVIGDKERLPSIIIPIIMS